MAKGTFSRMTDILKANINELLDRAEDPQKMIRQMVREMEDAVNKATASVGTAVANQKRLERQFTERMNLVQDWQGKAERAVEAGNDELGRRALERKSAFARAAADLEPVLEESRQSAAQLRDQLRELKTRLEEARARQGTLVARQRAAEAKKKMSQSISGLGADAFSSFERFEQKIEAAEAEAEAHGEIAGEMASIEKEVGQLGREKEVEEELAALKSRLSKGEQSAE